MEGDERVPELVAEVLAVSSGNETYSRWAKERFDGRIGRCYQGDETTFRYLPDDLFWVLVSVHRERRRLAETPGATDPVALDLEFTRLRLALEGLVDYLDSHH